MHITTKILIITILTGLFLCGCNSGSDFSPSQYPDLLRADSNPHNSRDWPESLFYDQGSWFGFGLPDSAISDLPGGFSGPFLHFAGKWASEQLVRLDISDTESGKDFNFQEAEKTLTYLPGRLVQNYIFKDLEVTLTLIFVSGHTALITADLMSLSGFHQSLNLTWSGITEDKIMVQPKGLDIILDQHGTRACIRVPGKPQIQISEKTGKFTLQVDKDTHMSTAGEISRSLVFSIIYPGRAPALIETEMSETLANSADLIKLNKKRWTGYITAILDRDNKWSTTSLYRPIAVKSIMTLMQNWKHARADLLHDGLFPSTAVNYFSGFRGWDSWKQAYSLAEFAPELAKNQIRAMLDYQNKQGMIADCIFTDKVANNWRNTKPPLAAWAVWQIYQKTQDKEFLQETLPKLVKFHTWWYNYRDHDNNGLCEYGSTDGTLTAAKWESGMDDGLRFDNTKIIRNGPNSWSMDQESVDLNSYLYIDKLKLAAIHRILGQQTQALQIEHEAEQLKLIIQKHMFDPENGFFHDRRLADQTLVRVSGPEGWIPLWAGIATPAQALQVKNMIMNTEKFATYLPFPTVPADHHQYMTGYWRGPVWLDQAWFGIKALQKYGFNDEADLLIKRLFDNASGLKDKFGAIRENYDPGDGRGLKTKHFSWSAAHLLMLFSGE